MRVQRFDWDSRNIEHMARHRVEPVDAESVCRSGRSLVRRGREGRYLIYGQTSEGRHLFVVLHASAGGVVRIITARDMSETERRLYQRRS